MRLASKKPKVRASRKSFSLAEKSQEKGRPALVKQENLLDHGDFKDCGRVEDGGYLHLTWGCTTWDPGIARFFPRPSFADESCLRAVDRCHEYQDVTTNKGPEHPDAEEKQQTSEQP